MKTTVILDSGEDVKVSIRFVKRGNCYHKAYVTWPNKVQWAFPVPSMEKYSDITEWMKKQISSYGGFAFN